ncbi:putative Cytochrome P450 benzoate 4-monooxygenase [Taphrina deformans PYCC 5710]|uniref:Cytochrome P450 benzoate 4-monooxygenase n=1 Tax=Taphrina deformans (strain PYCC 5710 / ATCC 11124 / CBS 356.35 / IMI 108563 / JCM 9778 / NBRC 8474) TaxID=1097556 RepID=R4XCJ3_TAPDE|nr:putative Cytochrome P450 benzoate 4-monooxygenase [Taphrina deformans PYCC 5710]|eukprot:CCG83326.1 putative Cytochrome P450 benzoate 4-monooxygenase [Taphrina deformans PYCC 5710]
MGVLQELLISPLTYVALIVGMIAYPYLSDPLEINWVPGPLLAKFSPLWLFWEARNARRFRSVHRLHQEYGKFVRLSTDHVSINDCEAIPIVYGHGTGTLKAGFYDAFVSIHRGLFNTRDRAEHTRKRKIVSHTFSQQNIIGFEPYIQHNIAAFLEKMNALVDRSEKGAATFDFLPWANYLAFDIIGDLAFGTPFNFVRDEADTNDAIRILNERGEWSATVGIMPYIKLWTPYMFWDSFFPKGLKSVKDLATIAITAVEKRLKTDSDRKDLLSFLIKARDSNGNAMPDGELKAEALTQLIAGSDTTSNSITSILDVLCRNPEEYEKLKGSIDDMMAGLGISRDDSRLADFSEVQNNRELLNCIWESMRIRPTSALGLPRSVPAQGLTVCGRHFRAGTVLSVPSYSVHHDPSIYPDPYTFKPARFVDSPPNDKQFVPFSYGPRACIGRNVAMMELQTVLANLLYRFDFKRRDGNEVETVLREGFLVKPKELVVVMSRRT